MTRVTIASSTSAVKRASQSTEWALSRYCSANARARWLSARSSGVPEARVREWQEKIPRERLNGLAAQLVRRTFIICDEVLMQVGAKARDVDAVFLAGGATHLVQDGDRLIAKHRRDVGRRDERVELAVACSVSGDDQRR